jgi:hypothetical protein
MDVKLLDEPRTIYIQWSGDEQFIRKWSFKPFHLSKPFNAESVSVSDISQPDAETGDLVERKARSIAASLEELTANELDYIRLLPEAETLCALLEPSTGFQSLTAERDAALARVAELEAGLQACMASLGVIYMDWDGEPQDMIHVQDAFKAARALLERTKPCSRNTWRI